jgi:hypothetical protein
MAWTPARELECASNMVIGMEFDLGESVALTL